MEILSMPRGAGKTHQCILLSAERGWPILVPTRSHAYQIKRQAIFMGKIIPEPIVFSDIVKNPEKMAGHELLSRDFIIDELDNCIDSILPPLSQTRYATINLQPIQSPWIVKKFKEKDSLVDKDYFKELMKRSSNCYAVYVKGLPPEK